MAVDLKVAQVLLKQELDAHRGHSYELFATVVDKNRAKGSGPDGKLYQIDIQAFWDDQPGGNIRG